MGTNKKRRGKIMNCKDKCIIDRLFDVLEFNGWLKSYEKGYVNWEFGDMTINVSDNYISVNKGDFNYTAEFDEIIRITSDYMMTLSLNLIIIFTKKNFQLLTVNL